MRLPKNAIIDDSLQHEMPIRVRTSTAGIDHSRALRISTRLTRAFRRRRAPDRVMVDASRIIKLLNDANIGFVLMGTHGVEGWRSEARATDDIDFLITKKDHAKAVRTIQAAFPELLMWDSAAVTRFLDPKTKDALIDLMKPNFNLYKKAFRNSEWVGDKYRIPNLEMALASKFAAMIAPERRANKRNQDYVDFTDIVETNHPIIDRSKLKQLGEIVQTGGGQKILDLVDRIVSGGQTNLIDD